MDACKFQFLVGGIGQILVIIVQCGTDRNQLLKIEIFQTLWIGGI